jgi:hypothetical protein
MAATGSAAHQALTGRMTGHYPADPRVRAVLVFGSVSASRSFGLGPVRLALPAQLGREQE